MLNLKYKDHGNDGVDFIGLISYKDAYTENIEFSMSRDFFIKYWLFDIITV